MSGLMMIKLAAMVNDEHSFAKGCESYIQTEFKKVMRLDRDEVKRLFRLYQDDPNEAIADLMIIGLGAPRSMMRSTLDPDYVAAAKNRVTNEVYCRLDFALRYPHYIAHFDRDVVPPSVTLNEHGEALFTLEYQEPK